MKKFFAGLVGLCVMAATPLFAALDLAVSELPKEWAIGEAPTAWEKGDVYVLEFWATWCGPCRKAMPHIEALHQELQDEGVHIIGVNAGEKRSKQEIVNFLQKLPVPPTYPIAMSRGEGLPEKLKVQGIPRSCLVMDGKVLWGGHPSQLTVDGLRVLKATGSIEAMKAANEKPVAAPSDNPYATMLQLEKSADESAARGNFERAVALQLQAILAHPLQKRLANPYIPTVVPESNSRVLTDAPATFTSELLGLELPSDPAALTVVTYWTYPWWEKAITQQSLPLLPGVREAHVFTAPYRSITLVEEKSREKTAALLKKMGHAETEVLYRDTIDRDTFKVNDRYKYPYVALYLEGELLYIGALEAMPSVFKGPLLTPEQYRAAMAAEETLEDASKELFLQLRAGQKVPALETRMTTGYAALSLPYFFAQAHHANDVATASPRVDKLMALYHDDMGILETLLKLIDAWPELAEATPAQQERIALALAESNQRIAPAYAVGYLIRAADCAKRLNAPERAEDYIRRAIRASGQTRRLRDFKDGIAPLPSF